MSFHDRWFCPIWNPTNAPMCLTWQGNNKLTFANNTLRSIRHMDLRIRLRHAELLPVTIIRGYNRWVLPYTDIMIKQVGSMQSVWTCILLTDTIDRIRNCLKKFIPTDVRKIIDCALSVVSYFLNYSDMAWYDRGNDTKSTGIWNYVTNKNRLEYVRQHSI